MLVLNEAQMPLPLGGIMGDEVFIWDQDLDFIDGILADDLLGDIAFRAIARNTNGSASRGRRRVAANRTLRTIILKHIKNWSFPQLYKELQRNLDYRAFTRSFEKPIRSISALSRNACLLDDQAMQELNERLRQIAVEEGVIQGKVFRQDTTVCETNVHHPTDSSLLQDGVRVLTRIAKKAEAIVPSLPQLRDRTRAVARGALEVVFAVRGKGDKAKERRDTAYAKLMKHGRAVSTGAKRIMGKLKDGRVTRHLDLDDQLQAEALNDELETMIPRIEKVLWQTRARIVRGVTNSPDKILSLFVPETCVIRKGKAHKPTEFGRVVSIEEVEAGFVSGYQVLEGNPGDATIFMPALVRHKERFGHAPRKAATDSGFWSAANEKAAYGLGVKRVSIPARGKPSAFRRVLQKTRWFKQLQRWRANGEGRIGTLKNTYGLDRCMYKGDMAMERWVGWCVFAHNLVVMARAARKMKENDASSAGPKGPQRRKVA